MAVVIRRRSALAFVGLAAPVPEFPLGAKVSVVSPRASRFVCRDGDSGVVVKLCRAGGCRDVRPRDDLYFVRLDNPQKGKEVVYLTYLELLRG